MARLSRYEDGGTKMKHEVTVTVTAERSCHSCAQEGAPEGSPHVLPNPTSFTNMARFVIHPQIWCHFSFMPKQQIWHGLFPAIRLYLEHYPTYSSQSSH